MSTPSSPSEQRANSHVHPALHPSVTNVPVTPGVSLTGKSNYLEPDDVENLPQPPSRADNASSNETKPGGAGSKTSYFTAEPDPISEKDLPKNTGTEHDVDKSNQKTNYDPRAAHPGLNLSGGIISATMCLPYDLGYSGGNDWVA